MWYSPHKNTNTHAHTHISNFIFGSNDMKPRRKYHQCSQIGHLIHFHCVHSMCMPVYWIVDIVVRYWGAKQHNRHSTNARIILYFHSLAMNWTSFLTKPFFTLIHLFMFTRSRLFIFDVLLYGVSFSKHRSNKQELESKMNRENRKKKEISASIGNQ